MSQPTQQRNPETIPLTPVNAPRTSTLPAPSLPVPSQPAPSQSTSSQPASSQHTASQSAALQSAPSQPPSSQQASSQSTPSPPASSQSTPSSPASSQHTPSQAAPSQATPSPLAPPLVAATSQAQPKDWRSGKLGCMYMIGVIFTEACLIAAIIYLERRSATKNGITSVPQTPAPLSGHFDIHTVWNYGLLWSVFPTFVLTVFKIFWDDIVEDITSRQPFVELARGTSTRAASAKTTILLDYRSYSSFTVGCHAIFRKGHYLLGFSMLLGLFLSVGVIPLSAYLFFQAPSQTISATNISLITTFNDSAVTSTVSMQPAIDLATSIRVYSGTLPAWMTLEYAFEAFEAGLVSGNSVGNVTQENATAYSAYLDCQIYNESFASNVDDTLTYNIRDDRGCDVSGFTLLDSSEPHTYAKSWYNLCSNNSNGDRRIGMIAGIYSDIVPLHLTNFSIISCIPSYFQKNGPLTVSIELDTSPQFVSFAPNLNSSILPFSYQNIEDNLQYYSFFDPSRTVVADAFGASILLYAGVLNSSSPMMSEVMKNATEDMFTTIYAGLARSIMLEPAEPAQEPTIQARLSTPVTRLYVTMPLAYAIVVVLFLILVCNVGLFRKRFTEPTFIEEPIGLLGYATLLLDSNIFNVVSNASGQHRPAKKSLVEFVAEKYTVQDSKCYLDRTGGNKKIVVEHLELSPTRP